ncbi:MAG: magnesium and cobalt transport protein CorA, partial [Desulfobacca sp.]|nr:magnesium and cobalt transport protein CorA [Desulfobacca sp.]
MPALTKKRSRKAGLPPGTPVHIGEQKSEATRIVLFNYDEQRAEEKELTRPEECFPFKDQSPTVWITICGLHQVEILEKLNECFRLHPLVLEDILNTDQRPKMEDFGDYLYIVLKTLSLNGGQGDEVLSEQVSLILGPNYVLSFQEKEGPLFEGIRDRIRNGKGRIRKMGPDYLVHALLDTIIDHYF